jgi:hypothetical protein
MVAESGKDLIAGVGTMEFKGRFIPKIDWFWDEIDMFIVVA